MRHRDYRPRGKNLLFLLRFLRRHIKPAGIPVGELLAQHLENAAVQSDQLAAFSDDDEKLLAAYARILAMALTHARIHQARSL